nr:hypothetical protein GCM10020093_020630 [Planobispora longispora]
MSAGSVLGTIAVLAWSQVHTLIQLYAVFAVIGVASAMVLYQSAFAVIVAWFDGQARGRANALLALTVVAASPPPSSCRCPACWWSTSAGARPW